MWEQCAKGDGAVTAGSRTLNGMNPDTGRVGVIVVRAWTEAADDSLRARITWTLDVSRSGEEESHAAASIEQVLAAVREWLDAFRTAPP